MELAREWSIAHQSICKIWAHRPGWCLPVDDGSSIFRLSYHYCPILSTVHPSNSFIHLYCRTRYPRYGEMTVWFPCRSAPTPASVSPYGHHSRRILLMIQLSPKYISLFQKWSSTYWKLADYCDAFVVHMCLEPLLARLRLFSARLLTRIYHRC
jgi:hypothetical protein